MGRGKGPVLPADQPTHGRPGVPVARPGQLDPLPAEHPPPAAQHIHLRVVELVGTSGTGGEGGEEAAL